MRYGSHLDPPIRFESVHQDREEEHLLDEDALHEAALLQDATPVEYLDDQTQSILSENASPDIPFRFSVNPYRGCVHGCSYCYARNTHEYLGLNAGRDFETKILVKRQAPRLLREALAKPSWAGEPITFSGVTDCYQPAERRYELTRQCLEIVSSCHQPVSLITKNALVVRDCDILASLALRNLVHVNLSITTLDPLLARVMEPRTSIPAARLRAIETLASAGIPVRVLAAPIIPGLNDHEIPAILRAARDAGAADAGYTLLRLPQSVEPVFREWLQRCRPDEAAKVESRLLQARNGRLSESQWGRRMTGTGELATQIRTLVRVFRTTLGLSGLPTLDSSRFRPPLAPGGQLRLFDGSE